MALRTRDAARASARDRLLEAAAARFYADGVTATGVDTITREAGVAKMSLYNNFASKDDLVEAYLERRHAEWLELYAVRLSSATTPTERVLAVFDAYDDHAAAAYQGGFRGCGLLNAAAELPSDHPGRAVVREHKQQVEEILTEHLREIDTVEDAPGLAEHLSFLLEGAMARAGLEREPARLAHARQLATRLVGG